MPGEAAGQVNLVVALSCEARPLIRHFSLRQTMTVGGLRIYENASGMSLLVSGSGKSAMAAACGFLAGIQQGRGKGSAAWLNVGIAGHGGRRIGEGVLINRVMDNATGRASCPPLILDIDCPTSGLVTVDSPESNYPADVAYDMEGSVFVTTVTRFTTAELVHLFKIVSDTPEVSADQLTEKMINDLIEHQLDTIDRLATGLGGLASEYNAIYGLSGEFHRLAELTRLTASQRVQLESLYRRYYALGGANLQAKIGHSEFRSGKELLQTIQGLIPAL